MAGNQVSTSPFSDTYEHEAYPLGATRLELATEVRVGNSGVDTSATYSLLDGDRVWIFVQAAAAIAAGSLCKRNALTTPFVVAEDAASETNVWPNLVVIADHAIASGSYGWIIKSGACVVEAETGVAAADLLASDGNNTAGEVDTIAAGANTAVVGYALEAEGATTAGYAQAMVHFPG